jgi:hypothetical protein
MNWDAMGAIGETLGSLGVLITLVYLAIQVKSMSPKRGDFPLGLITH